MAIKTIKGLTLKSSPNQYLVCPAGYAASKPHHVAPEYQRSAADLARLWKEVVGAQPRTQLVAEEDSGLRQEHTQKTALIRFTDVIISEFLASGEGKSTLAVYSRSLVGYSDFGANKKRIEAWLAELDIKAS